MTAIDSSRRAFLRGRVRSDSSRLPPWSRSDFTDLCERCDACVEACEEGILARGDGGFPQVDFSRGGCTFCQSCVSACEHDAFRQPDEPPWRLSARPGERCLSAGGIVCRSCGDACEARAIRFRLQVGGSALPEIDSSRCNGCGACYAVCPTTAILIEEAA